MPPKTQEKTIEAKTFNLSHCRHAADDYSIRIGVENTHVDICTYSWDDHPGYRAQFSFFDMTTQDIKALGEAIIKEALTIELEEQSK